MPVRRMLHLTRCGELVRPVPKFLPGQSIPEHPAVLADEQVDGKVSPSHVLTEAARRAWSLAHSRPRAHYRFLGERCDVPAIARMHDAAAQAASRCDGDG